MSEAHPTPVAEGSRLEDAALRSAFGFDADDEGWLSVVRRAAEGASAAEGGVIGPYRLLDQVGRGAQGTVYKAVQPGTNRPIAIKRLAAGALASPGALARFEREIEAVSALSHPCVVTVLGAEVIDGQPLLMMEWVDGAPIDRWAGGGIEVGAAPTSMARPMRARLEVFAQVCDAVSHAHQRGVLHRDLKPSNILVDGAGRPRVLDFGLAKLIDAEGGASAASHAGFIGTPAYAAPEQVGGRPEEIDTRTDIYALGVVLYQVLTGTLPFPAGADLASLFDAIRRDDPAPPSRLSASIGGELDAIVLKAMAKDRERRYQSADALAADVRRYLAGETVLAHPPSFLYQARTMVRRHRIPVAIGAGAGVLVLGSAVVSSVLAVRLAERRRDLAGALTRAQDAQQQATQQAEQARKSQKQAEAEAARSAASAEFLREMLSSLGQAAAAGQAQPSLQMLREARGRLEAGEMAGQPQAEVTLWRTLAYTYFQSSYHVEAEECMNRAMALLPQRFGPGDAETGMCLLTAGLVAENRHDHSAAMEHYRRAVGILEKSLGEDNRETARAINNLGNLLKGARRYDEAEACYTRALAIRTRLFGPEHRDVATSLLHFGVLMTAQKRYDEAQVYFDRALSVARGLRPVDEAMVARIDLRLAALARVRGDLGRAEQILRGVVDRMRRLYGEDSLASGRCAAELAEVLWQADRKEEALRLYDSAVAVYRKNYAADHLELALHVRRHGQMLLGLGRLDEALVELTDAVRLAQGLRPARPDHVLAAERSLVECLRLLGRKDEADGIEREMKSAAPAR